MTRYKNINGDSGVYAYETSPTSITVQFSSGWFYLYNYGSAGTANIETMKRLAAQGDGLNSFINKNAKNSYVRKWR